MSNMIWPVFILLWAFISYGAIWLMFHLLFSRWSIKLPLSLWENNLSKHLQRAFTQWTKNHNKWHTTSRLFFGCTQNIHASEGNTFWGSSAFFYSFKLMLATFCLLALLSGSCWYSLLAGFYVWHPWKLSCVCDLRSVCPACHLSV